MSQEWMRLRIIISQVLSALLRYRQCYGLCGRVRFPKFALTSPHFHTRNTNPERCELRCCHKPIIWRGRACGYSSLSLHLSRPYDFPGLLPVENRNKNESTSSAWSSWRSIDLLLNPFWQYLLWSVISTISSPGSISTNFYQSSSRLPK